MKSRLLIYTIASSASWYALTLSRKHIMQRHCLDSLTSCVSSEVWSIDRWAIHAADRQIDYWSFVTQDSAGALALGTVLTLAYKTRQRWMDVAYWFLALLFSTSLNGALNELVRNLVQRPRPFVYLDPTNLGTDPAHYTSFYSGHTSFAMAISMTGLLSLHYFKVSKPKLRMYGLLAAGLVLATATFRVLAGRHFPTDTLAGMVMGGAAGWAAFVAAKSHEKV